MRAHPQKQWNIHRDIAQVVQYRGFRGSDYTTNSGWVMCYLGVQRLDAAFQYNQFSLKALSREASLSMRKATQRTPKGVRATIRIYL